MADLKNELFDYLAQRHFDLMPPDVHDRFEEWADKGAFRGNMKEWNTRFAGHSAVALYFDPATEATDWEKLYDACQKTFQQMDGNKQPSYGYGSDYNAATKSFIEKFFGNNTKTFTASKATTEVSTLLKDLGAFLDTNKADIKPRFTTQLSYVFNDIRYEDFCDKLKKGKFDDDIKFRDKVESVIQYITTYGPRPGYPMEPDDSMWPNGLGYDMTGAAGTVNLLSPVLQGLHNMGGGPKLDKDHPETWYEIPNKGAHITQFKTDYREIFDTLLTDATIRKHFLAVAENPVREVLEKAIAKTDYENKESDDYVPPMPIDEKNWRQKINKWANDTYENHFRRFTNPTRGTRKFFSPQIQNIMKALDKAGVKPTDGIDGILAKKDDPKLKNVVNQDPDTIKHFDWFVKTMSTIKEEMPDTYADALKNGHHLRDIAMRIIETTKKEDIEKAKTALEILSVAKYGLVCSNRLNKLNEATKDMKLLNDSGYSWMKKDSPTAFVANAAEGLLGAGIRGVAATATGVYNFVQHRRTKIDKDLTKYKNSKGAYKNFYDARTKWEAEDTKKHNDLRAENIAHNVSLKLTTLAAGAGLSGEVIANDADLAAKETMLAGMPPGPAHDNLQADIDLYKDASARKKRDDDWRKDNPDVMSILTAHWNMLENVSMTHSFTLGSMAIKRKAMFENETVAGKTQTHAKHVAEAYYNRFGSLRAA